MNCRMCGAELAENQLICTNCGMRVQKGQMKAEAPSFSEEKSGRDVSADSVIRYKNIYYKFRQAGHAIYKKGKSTLVVCEDRIDFIKEHYWEWILARLGMFLTGFIGLFLAGFFAEIFCLWFGYFVGRMLGVVLDKIIGVLWPLKSVKASIIYASVTNCCREDLFWKHKVVVTLENGDVYRISVRNKQDEIFERIRKRFNE